MDKNIWRWERKIGPKDFLVSSDRDLLPHPFVQEAFATEAMFWAKPVSSTTMETMLGNSFTLGLYEVSNDGATNTPIGMARMITDYATLAYLTDVYLQPEFRSLGLGKWIIQCCREFALEIPDLRFLVLLTGNEQAQQLYRREFGMQNLDGKEEALVCMGARRAKIVQAAAAAAPST